MTRASRSLTDPMHPTGFHSTVIDHLWHQWTVLGIAGAASRPDSNTPPRVIDPEALVLATTVFGRHDTRLFDEALDWLVRNGERINLQRLRNLEVKWHLSDPLVLAAAAEVVAGERSALAKWRKLCGPPPDRHKMQAPEPFYLDQEGRPTPLPQGLDPGDLDRRFLHWSLARPAWTPRGMSRGPDPSRPENLLFKLRSLFGTNSRAEIVAWLLLNGPASPAALSRELGYFSKTIQGVLNEMALSGHLVVQRVGREKRFQMRLQEWEFLHGDQPKPSWINWCVIYAVAGAIHQTALATGLRGVPEEVRSIELRRRLELLPEAVPTAIIPEAASHRPSWDRLESELSTVMT